MSAGNFEIERKRNYELKRRVIDATATVRTGRAVDHNMIDPVIDIVDPAAGVTLTVPDGTYVGQKLLITFSSDANGQTVTVTTTTGGDYSLTAVGDYASLEWVNSTSGWIYLSEVST